MVVQDRASSASTLTAARAARPRAPSVGHARAADALEATRSVALHSIEAATVFLSVCSRTRGVAASGLSTSLAVWVRRTMATALRALEELGEASTSDLTKSGWWTGWTSRETRRALAALPHAVVQPGRLDGLCARRRPRARRGPRSVRSSPPHALPDHDGLEGARLVPRRARAPPLRRERQRGSTVWWDGPVVGGWTRRRDGEIVYRLLEDVGSEAVGAIEAEAERLAGWIGDARIASGFLPPSSAAWPSSQSPRGMKISLAITSRWICEVPS